MSFESTKKLFYKEGTHFQDVLAKMKDSPNCLHLNLKIGKHECFFYYGMPMFEMILKLEKANMKAISAFAKLPGVAQNQFLRNSLVEEIKQTNEIEGVFSSKREIFELLEDLKKRKKKKIGSIVNKYQLLLDGKQKSITSCEDIRAIYDEMFFGGEEPLIDPDDKPDGKLFRTKFVGVYTDTDNKPIHQGLLPEEKIIEALDEAIRILNDQSIDAFVRIALFHFIFEYVHPFYDGNGRVGRFAASLSLSNECGNLIAAFLLSKEIKKQKRKYYKLFEETEDVRNFGDLSTFAYGFMEILLSSLEGCTAYAEEQKEKLNTLFEQTRKSIGTLSKREEAVLYYLCQARLFSDFGIEAYEVADCNEVSWRTAKRVLDSFVEKGVASKENYGRKTFYNLASKGETANAKA